MPDYTTDERWRRGPRKHTARRWYNSAEGGLILRCDGCDYEPIKGTTREQEDAHRAHRVAMGENVKAQRVLPRGVRLKQAEAERDRYRLAWQSARRRASDHQTAARTFSDGGVDDIAELYHAQAAIQATGGQLTRSVHQAIDAIRAKWDQALRWEQQKRTAAEAEITRLRAVIEDMATPASEYHEREVRTLVARVVAEQDSSRTVGGGGQ